MESLNSLLKDGFGKLSPANYDAVVQVFIRRVWDAPPSKNAARALAKLRFWFEQRVEERRPEAATDPKSDARVAKILVERKAIEVRKEEGDKKEDIERKDQELLHVFAGVKTMLVTLIPAAGESEAELLKQNDNVQDE